MSVDNRECNECGATDWKQVIQTDYPERRQERDRTVQTVYECCDCGSEGKHFVHNDGTADIFSGAMREK